MPADPQHMHDRDGRMGPERTDKLAQHLLWLTGATGDQVDIATRLGAPAVAPTDRRHTVGHEPAQHSRRPVSTQHAPRRQYARHLGAEYARSAAGKAAGSLRD